MIRHGESINQRKDMETKITPSICTKIKSCNLERYLGNQEIDFLNLQATLHYQVYLNEGISSSYVCECVRASTIILLSLLYSFLQ